MVRLTRIYTRTGDEGKTSLAGGERVSKTNPRIEAYGTVDELNACIGLILASLGQVSEGAEDMRVSLEALRWIQQRLFDIGATLATLPPHRRPDTPGVRHDDVTRLEEWIDILNRDLEPLKSFVLPGGSVPAAQLHLARTVCRRAERRMCALRETGEPVDPHDAVFVNRLSDYLFVLSRWINRCLGAPEPLWEHRPPSPSAGDAKE